MDEPTVRNSRLALAGGLVIALAAAGAGFLIGRGTSPRSVAPEMASLAPRASETPAVAPIRPEIVDAAKSRADFIELAGQAADALASGQAMPGSVAEAVGRRFELRLPFGCRGPSDVRSDTPMRWRYDELAKALRVHVEPVVWSGAEAATAGADPTTADAAEGFWISRPWTTSEECPPVKDSVAPTGSDAVTLPGQTLAVSEFFADGEARLSRRDGKPYEAVIRMSHDRAPYGRGLRLRLAGRIADTKGGGPISCRQPAGSEQRPICIVAVKFDEVAIDDPQAGKTLATWNVGSATGPDQ